MPFEKQSRAAALLRDAQAIKIIAAADETGTPRVICDPAVTLDDAGRVLYPEFAEHAARSAALLGSLWFGRPVMLHVEKNGEAYEITGHVARAEISGPLFERCYKEALTRDPNADLSTVWIILPERTADVSLPHLLAEEAEKHPLTVHLDHLAR